MLSLGALMADCADQVEIIMQWLSRSPTARVIDREIGKAEGPLGGTALCSYLRYNVQLTTEWFEQNLAEKPGSKKLKALEAMDDPNNIDELDRIGRLAGSTLVMDDHFPKAFNLP